MTVLAAVKLMPKPPARVDKMKIKYESSLLKVSINDCLKIKKKHWYFNMKNFNFSTKVHTSLGREWTHPILGTCDL